MQEPEALWINREKIPKDKSTSNGNLGRRRRLSILINFREITKFERTRDALKAQRFKSY